MNRTTLVALLLTVATACSSGTVRPPEPLSASATECAGRYVPDGVVHDATVDLTGTWAYRDVRVSVSSAPFIGDVTTTVTTLSRMEITQDGGALDLAATVCDIANASDNDSARSEIPAEFVSALPMAIRQASLAGVDGGGHVFFSDELVEVRGADLSSPDALLPDDEDDPRVVDQDGDGEPGMTIRIYGMADGEMYIVQRLRTSLCGYCPDPDHFDGHIDWSLEQYTLGASRRMLDRQPNAQPHSNPERHTFRSTRIDGATTCEEIVAQAPTLFARTGD